jgi:uncharacterized protein (DUF433 family)
MATAKRKILGRYIVADPEICHGKPTFIGTRIMVWQILKQVSNGESWDEIVEIWGGRVTKEMVAEAVAVAALMFEDKTSNFKRLPIEIETQA